MIYRLLNRAGESKKIICGTCGKEKVITWWGENPLGCGCNHLDDKGVSQEEVYHIRRRGCKEHYIRNWVEEENNKGVYTFRKMEEELLVNEEGGIPTVTESKVIDTLVVDLAKGQLYYQSPKGRICPHSRSRLSRLITGSKLTYNSLLSIWYNYWIKLKRREIPKTNVMSCLESMYKLGWEQRDIEDIMNTILLSYQGEDTSIYKVLGIHSGEEKYIFRHGREGFRQNSENYIIGFLDMSREKKDWIIRFKKAYPEVRLDGYGISRNLQRMFDAGYNPEKLAQYITQDVVWQGLTDPREVLGILRDVVDMVANMEGAKLNRYPKSLKLYHDITAMNYNKLKEEVFNKKFNERVTSEEYKKREWVNEKYSILSPKEAADLVREGQTMNHCVALYVDRVANGESDIYFLRKNEQIEKSLVTIEVCDNTVEQSRAKANGVPQQEELKALAEWIKARGLKNNVKFIKII